MSNIVNAVVSNGWRSELAQFYGNGGASITLPHHFIIGCGGWTNTVNGHQPNSPDPTLTALTAGTGIYTGGDYSFIFTKNFVIISDLVYIAPRRARVHCFVDTGEANLTSNNNPPQFFELGVFDASNVMLVYSTFPMEVKTVDKTLEHFIYIDF
jgi:hypothetical protein